MSFKFSSGIKQVPKHYFMPNVGCLMDVPLGSPVLGIHGQYITNGGHSGSMGFAGPGNSYKSALADHVNEVAAFRTHSQSTGMKYDTETNVSIPGLTKRLRRITYPYPPDWFETGRWEVTDSSLYAGDEWFKFAKDFMNSKVKMGAEAKVDTQLVGSDGKPIRIIMPTYITLDSMSRFEVSKIQDIRDGSSIGDSKQNMVNAHSGLYKMNMINELPNLLRGTNTYLTTTIHYGEQKQFDPYAPVHKALEQLDRGMKLKGVPENITFLTSCLWLVIGSAKMRNHNDKKLMEYPLKGAKEANDNADDLNIVSIKTTRNKTGPTGIVINLIVSQTYGVLENLTDFHFLRVHGGYGLTGSSVTGQLNDVRCVLMPDVKMTRTTVRSMLDENPRLSRALNILSNMFQMKTYWRDILMDIDPRLLELTPETLYTKIQEQGYKWDMILDTRYWSTLDDTAHAQLELSTLDIMRMALGTYHPYWLENDKVTIKKKYAKIVSDAQAATPETESMLDD